MSATNYIWAEKYRPNTIDECILPKNTKNVFKKYLESGHVPNLILSGTPGTGKTTTAKAMIKELGCDFMLINASLHGNIDLLRNEITQFATGVSMFGGKDLKKFVILDEGDKMSTKMQEGLRAFMDEFQGNCGFIVTCNYLNKIIDALQSRCTIVTFSIPKEEKMEIARTSLSRIFSILEKENISYDKVVVGQVYKKFMPDLRKVLGELQHYSGASETIDSGILSSVVFVDLRDLISMLKEREFSKMTEWVVENSDIETSTLATSLYAELKSSEKMDKSNLPSLVKILNDYDYKSSFVTDKDLNSMAMLTEIMLECF